MKKKEENSLRKRLFFVGLQADGELQEELQELKTKLAKEFKAFAALKAPPHITFIAPRYYTESELEELYKHLHRSLQHQERLLLRLTKYSFFDMRTFFIDIENTNELQSLQGLISRAAGDYNPEYHFHPHLTLLNRDVSEPSMQILKDRYLGKHYDKSIVAKEVIIYLLEDAKWKLYQKIPLLADK